MKELFNEARYREIAATLGGAASQFDAARFLKLTLPGLAERELMDRLRQTSIAFQASLPGGFPDQLPVLLQIAQPQPNSLVGCWFADYVGRYGIEHPKLALPALAHLTRFGSAEFAIREFLIRDQPATLQVMQKWARDRNEHVRRLASEGARPRLPWGKRLGRLVADPTPVRDILERLQDDPSRYVQKSVANHLNDITKDHPEVVLQWVKTWNRDSPRTQWIVQHGLRTLIKQAHPEALRRMGAGAAPKISRFDFEISPPQIRLGERITLKLSLQSTAQTAQVLLIDYLVHYVKAHGPPRPKVFKWTRVRVPPHGTITLTKTQTIKNFSTRQHHAGAHRIEIQINGRRLAEARFELSV